MVSVDGVRVSMKVYGFALLLWLSTGLFAGDFLVVTHRDSPFDSLTKFQLQQLYLGKMDRLNGARIFPVQTRKKDSLRKIFDDSIFGSHFDLEDYWLRQKLLVGADPPLTVANWALAMAFISRNPGYIGYIPADSDTNLENYNLKIIRITE